MASKMIIRGCDVPLCDTVRPENTDNCFPYSFKGKKKELLPKGWQKTPRSRPLPSEVIYEVNEEMRHSDGVKIYYDVCRPNTSEKVPALLALSPYGKGGHGFLNYELLPYRVGVKEEMLSGLEKFESVDPAEWVSRGYAVVNVDIRGSWDSEGDLYIEGMAPGRDAAEIVEHVAALPWCSGSIGMQGNSWLAAVQWSTAVVAPPSLKAIAPWEGFTDKYREVVCRGGIPDATFINLVYNGTIRGRNKREDILAAAQKWPLMNEYWEDKVIETEKIDIPIYAVASYSSGIHGYGTIQGFRKARSKKKWLRVHATQEWFDIYRPDMTDELQAFFDRYLKGIENDWEKTDPVRVSILTCADRFGPQPIEHFPIGSYPHPKTEYKRLYLSQDTLSTHYPQNRSVVSYQSDDLQAKAAEFVFRFQDTTTLMGFSKAKLWVSCDDSDDMDIYLSLRKVSKTGKVLDHVNIPWSAIPRNDSTQEDVTNTNVIKKVRPGDVVPVEIGIWPIGLKFFEGEGLMLRVRGSKDAYWEVPHLQKATVFGVNKGKHHIHFGGQFNSYVAVPFIPNV
ncbi:X-Pro dipeptidyl-peptidase C-terminal non-catalytic domain-containing protein [Colletotrichum karsti]|uniref:X-Pro dipeptidyl-peptidase C-terminal non-catalytic domain-containing protein n=1 Tax=Colletotrichum karsti TaxID=1095194 RepID=A0A9P6I1C4_9PEZI|nr:X-Pro dipeptidyl-peptidase C-terminal non-catalytic domain-containing protein [Colletotrichum karsti]KAF9875483.1 X-Pro dipeptidyl-peptidase C-terminal non-catalytic domain-containing protein [Colletotrichum karsti]